MAWEYALYDSRVSFPYAPPDHVVNYLPFLLAAFLCVRKKRFKWLPLCLLLICLSSFYFAISAFAAVGWYWYRTEGRNFWKESFLKRYIPSAVLASAMAAALLLPTALILLRTQTERHGYRITEAAGAVWTQSSL